MAARTTIVPVKVIKRMQTSVHAVKGGRDPGRTGCRWSDAHLRRAKSLAVASVGERAAGKVERTANEAGGSNIEKLCLSQNSVDVVSRSLVARADESYCKAMSLEIRRR